MTLAAFVDAEAVVREWINSRTGTLVGVGKPIPKGCHINRLRSSQAGAYVMAIRIGGYDDAGDAPIDYARMTLEVRASQRQAAAAAATALANELRTVLDGTQVTVDVNGATRRILGVDGIVGPSYYPDGDEERYVVDALFLVTPGP